MNIVNIVNEMRNLLSTSGKISWATAGPTNRKWPGQDIAGDCNTENLMISKNLEEKEPNLLSIAIKIDAVDIDSHKLMSCCSRSCPDWIDTTCYKRSR